MTTFSFFPDQLQFAIHADRTANGRRQDSNSMAPLPLIEPKQLRDRFLKYIKVDRFKKLSESKREEHLHKNFGQNSLTLAEQWYDLCHSDLGAVSLSDKEKRRGMKMFAVAHYFLWNYCKNAVVLGDRFDMCDDYASGSHLCLWIERIASLTKKKIKFPKGLKLKDAEIIALSVDGVDFATWERKHAKLPVDPKNKTHKYNHGGLKYQLTLCAQRNQCCDIYGPARGGLQDQTMLEQSEVLEELVGDQLACGDRGYIAAKFMKKMTWPNPHDSKAVNNFKSRIRLRHETYHCRMKKYGSMNQVWRHTIHQHGLAFRAVAVTVQYAWSNGTSIIFSA